jgi:hypothetical protein
VGEKEKKEEEVRIIIKVRVKKANAQERIIRSVKK